MSSGNEQSDQSEWWRPAPGSRWNYRFSSIADALSIGLGSFALAGITWTLASTNDGRIKALLWWSIGVTAAGAFVIYRLAKRENSESRYGRALLTPDKVAFGIPMAGRWPAMLGSLVVVLSLSGCGGGSAANTAPTTAQAPSSTAGNVAKHHNLKTLDPLYVAKLIRRQETRRYGLAPSAHVNCPGGIPIKPQTHFHCLIRANGRVTRLVVTIENRQGYLTWVVG